MKFERNVTYAGVVGELYGNRLGDYVETFTSDNGQVSAELFKKSGKLTAYVTFTNGFSGETVTDAYLSALRKRAAELGFESKVHIIYTGM